MANEKEQKKTKQVLSDYTAERIGEIICKMLDNCEATSWKKEWLPLAGMQPMNMVIKKSYSLRNSIFCTMAQISNGWKTSFYVTRGNIETLGISVLKGEQPSPILQYFPVIAINKDDRDDKLSINDYEELDDASKEDYRLCFSLKAVWEYNIDQTTLPTQLPDKYEQLLNIAKEEEKRLAERHIENVGDATLDHIICENGWWCPISFDGGDRAYCQMDMTHSKESYSIHLPKRVQFDTASAFYSTALHEMAHSTSGQLNRNYGEGGFGSSTYAKEELVAELASAICSHDLGIESKIDDNHLVYVNHWKSHCKDKEVISKIVVDMMKAVKYIMNYYYESKEELEELAA